MPRACSICRHPQRKAIDRALLGSASFRDIAKSFGLSSAAAHRHSKHIQRAVAAVVADDPVAYGRQVLAQVRTLAQRAVRILDRAEAEGDLRAATGAIREARSCFELLARLQGQIVERHALQAVVTDTERLRQRIIDARKMPEDLREALQKAAHWQILHSERAAVEDAEIVS